MHRKQAAVHRQQAAVHRQQAVAAAAAAAAALWGGTRIPWLLALWYRWGPWAPCPQTLARCHREMFLAMLQQHPCNGVLASL